MWNNDHLFDRIKIFGTFLLCVAECAAMIMLNDMSGVFESPAYPAPYGDDLDMTWKISAPPGFQVLIYFSVFDLEDSYDEELGGSCVYDFIEVTLLVFVVAKLIKLFSCRNGAFTFCLYKEWFKFIFSICQTFL